MTQEPEPPRRRIGFGGGLLLIVLAVVILAMAIDSVVLVNGARAPQTPRASSSR